MDIENLIEMMIMQAPSVGGLVVCIVILSRIVARYETIVERLIDVIVKGDNCRDGKS